MIYAMYETLAAQGLAGYFITRQMNWFGSASMAVTYCLAVFVYWAVPLVLGILLLLVALAIGKVWPPMGNIVSALFSGSPATPAPSPARVTPTSGNTGLRWSTIAKFGVTSFAIVGLLSAVLYFLNVRDQALGIYELNLDRQGDVLPSRIGFVKVTGHLARTYAAGYRDKSSRYLIVPITHTNWTPNTAVRFFVLYQELGSGDQEFVLPAPFRQPGAGEFGGRFSGRLPAFIQSDYEKKGLKLHSDYRILNYENTPREGTPRSDSHLIVLIVGGIVIIALLAPMVGIKLRGGAETRRRTAA